MSKTPFVPDVGNEPLVFDLKSIEAGGSATWRGPAATQGVDRSSRAGCVTGGWQSDGRAGFGAGRRRRDQNHR